MAKKRITVDDLPQIFQEMQQQNDRAMAVVVGSYVEMTLQDSIEFRWPPMSNIVRNRIFDGQGALATFSSKIEVAFAMGIYGPITREDLNSIRWIRNQFAHRLHPVTFEATDIAERVSKLKRALTPPSQPINGTSKNRFLYNSAAHQIATNLLISNPVHNRFGLIAHLP